MSGQQPINGIAIPMRCLSGNFAVPKNMPKELHKSCQRVGLRCQMGHAITKSANSKVEYP